MLLKELGEEETYYYHPDHLGSVSVVSNHRGEPYERVEYLPFGELWIEETDPATGYIPFRFTSKEYDEETGLYYYGARYYEPRLSRWMSADPAGWELVDPDKNEHLLISGLNWYSYTENNPIKYDDPSGGIPTVVIGAAVGGAVGAVAGVVSAVAQGNTSFREIAGGAAGGAISGAVTGALIGSGVGIPLVVGGSAVGGAAGSVVENLITGDAKTLGPGGVAKDAAIDGGISAVASVFAVGLGKVLGNFVDDAWSAVGKASNSDSWSKAFMKAYKLDKSAKTIKPIMEGGISLVNDIAQDQLNPTDENQN